MNPRPILAPGSVQEHWWVNWQNWSVDLSTNIVSRLIS